MNKHSLPFSQLALSVVDLPRSERFWGEGLGFVPAGGTRMFNGKALSGVTNLPNAAATTWWLIDRSDWMQLEIWQYENPFANLMRPDYAANDIGYSRCGVWVSDFDAVLARLADQEICPITEPMGSAGSRRVCVRDPDGIFVEIMEEDPLSETPVVRPDCTVALRSLTLSTPDLEESLKFMRGGLGMPDHGSQLHSNEHEALWGLAGAECKRQVLNPGTVLLEVVQYTSPKGKPRRDGARLNDQGILNYAIGDAKNAEMWKNVVDQAKRAGWVPGKKDISSPLGGCNYFTDSQQFNTEIMWTRPLGHGIAGFKPKPASKYPKPGPHRVEHSVDLPVSPAAAWDVLSDHEGISDWAGLGTVKVDSPAFDGGNGRGLERAVKTDVGPVREQVFEWVPNKHIGYRIIEGGPFSVYNGHIRLQPLKKGCRVVWSVDFRSRIPGAGSILRAVLSSKLRKAVTQGLPKELARRDLA